MEISWHPHERLVIVSLWSGTLCRATFRLPVEDATQVIQVLVDALGEAASGRTSSVEASERRPVFDTPQRPQHTRAEITILADYPRRENLWVSDPEVPVT
jgi:hypothetical protein